MDTDQSDRASYLSCLSTIMESKQRCMTQNRSHMWDDRQLPDTDAVYRRQALSPPSCLFAFLVLAALACGGCQTSTTPLPNPPSAYTPVTLAPGAVITLS